MVIFFLYIFKNYECEKIYLDLTYAFISFVDHKVTHNLGNFQASVNSKKKNTCNLEHM